MLKIADNLSLPLDAVTGTFAILAIRGVGKTHTASVLAEEMLEAGQPIVAYDPTGAWWGLKSRASGKQAGYPVVVFGGEHADVPLEEAAGETIASTIVSKRIPAILDCSLLRKAARIRFMTAFCETLYHQNREPLHLFLDEAHTVAPQSIRAMPEMSRLLGALEDIILQGRRRGLGLTAISPRPAMLNTSIRSACQTLIAMRIVGQHDRKAVEEWVEAHAAQDDLKKFLTSLAGLPRGEGWIWNPAEDLFEHVKFRARRTFDSSATPKVGGKVITPQRMAKIDLETLGAAIKSTVETAKANDPKELKKRVAELERELATAKPAKPAAAVTKTVEKIKRVEVPALSDGQLKRIEKVAEKLGAIGAAALARAQELTGALANVAAAKAAPAASTPQLPPFVGTLRNGAKPQPAPRPPVKHRPAEGGMALGKGGAGRMLMALAQHPEGVSYFKLALLTGMSKGSGTFGTYLSKLRSEGYVEGDRSRLTITHAGLEAAVDFEPLPTGPALIDCWRGQIGDGGIRRLLDVLVEIYPQSLTKPALAEAAGMAPGSGTFGTYLSKLRTLGLVLGQRELSANPYLFEE